jgi:Cu/Ag efflux pump CusA
MLNTLIRWSLRNRAIILCLSLLILAMGFKTGSELPVEVLPDLTKPTVTILTEAPGLSPEEVEALAERCAQLLDDGIFPAPSGLTPAVPWPLF